MKEEIVYSKKKACATILISILFLLLIFYGVRWILDGGFFRFSTIRGIILPETGLRGEQIAEILGLSTDSTKSYLSFNDKAATLKLSSHPVIKKAMVKKKRGGWILVDYEMRVPIAVIGNFTNTVIDSEGVLFPYFPFYMPKRIPLVYLPMKKNYTPIWGNTIAKEEIGIVSSILALFSQEEKESLQMIDISHFDEENLGKEEITIKLKEKGEKTLRLNAPSYREQWRNWKELKKHLEAGDYIIDMRLVDLAFIVDSG